MVFLDIRYPLKFGLKVRKSTGKVLCSIRHNVDSVSNGRQAKPDGHMCPHKGRYCNMEKWKHLVNLPFTKCLTQLEHFTWHHYQKMNSTADNMSANSLSTTGHDNELKLRLLRFFLICIQCQCAFVFSFIIFHFHVNAATR